MVSKRGLVGLLTALLLAGCGQAGGPAPVNQPTTELVAQDAQVDATDEYVSGTVDTIASAAGTERNQLLDAFIGFSRDNSDLDKPVKQRVASQLLDRLASFGLSPADLTKYRSQLETIARGQFSVVPTPPGPRVLSFPRDDGAHHNLTEWWYYTGHLAAADGRRYGYEVTFFRVLPVFYFAHIAITDEQTGHFAYTRNFFLPSQTSIADNKLDIRYKDSGVQALGPQHYKLWGGAENFRFTLDIQNKRSQPLLIDGDGYIPFEQKSFTYYYSLTRMDTKGELSISGQPVPVTGQSWMDHQWGNFAPSWPITVTGWNWFSVQMNDGTEYNLFELLPWSGNPTPLQEANVMRPDGSSEVVQGLQLEKTRIWRSPRTGKAYVVEWNVTIPGTGEKLHITADVDDQEMARRAYHDIAPNYWEGSCKVTRTGPDGKLTEGVGYTEQTRVAKDPTS